jgi:hypothetical protein
VPGRPLVPCPYGIRRRRQHLSKASGRGWGSAGRPNGLKVLRPLRLSSSLGFLPHSRRQPHPVGRMRRSLRQVRPLRPLPPGGRLVRRRSPVRRPGFSLGPVLDPRPGLPSVRALQRLRALGPQRPLRSVRRRRPANLARRPRDPSARASRRGVRPLPKAEHLFRQSPLLLDRKPAGLPDLPLLPRGCRDRRCSPPVRLRSRYRARRRTQ